MAQPQAKTEAPEKGMHRYLEFTISGSYYNSKRETIDFEGVKGKIPFCDEENGIGSMHVRRRFAEKWVREALNKDGEPKYPDRIEKMRQVFIDDTRETTGTLSFVGKSLKDLSIEEMQELAVAKDLRLIPLPKSGMSKRDMQVMTYVAYSDKVLMHKVKYQEGGFNFAKLPDIVLDAQGRREVSQKISNDEIIDLEIEKGKAKVEYGAKDNPKERFSIEELRTILDGKRVTYDVGSTFDELYALAFSG